MDGLETSPAKPTELTPRKDTLLSRLGQCSRTWSGDLRDPAGHRTFSREALETDISLSTKWENCSKMYGSGSCLGRWNSTNPHSSRMSVMVGRADKCLAGNGIKFVCDTQ